MRFNSKSLSRLAATAALSLFCGAFSGGSSAFAASDSHCFAKPEGRLSGTAIVTMDDVDIELDNTTDPEQQAALQELDRRQWAMRMAQNPWLDDGNIFPTQGGKRLMVGPDGALLVDAYAAMDFDIHKEEMNRRTGSKYIYVSPAMKKLARERNQLRALKRKPCNPHILYLGGS